MDKILEKSFTKLYVNFININVFFVLIQSNGEREKNFDIKTIKVE